MSKKNLNQYIWPDLIVSVENGLVTFENGKSVQYDPVYLPQLITQEQSDYTKLEDVRIKILFNFLAPLITHELYLCQDEKEKKNMMVNIVERLIREGGKIQLPEHSHKKLYEIVLQTYIKTIQSVMVSFSETWNTYRDMAYAKTIGKEFADQATFQDYESILHPLTPNSNGNNNQSNGKA
jgi:hypothetical protein